jgi:REP element-mobilizing transposase RayT
MSTGYQIEYQFAMYFVTFTVVDWVDVFTRSIYKDILIESLNFCCNNRGLKVYGYVIMSNHMHLIVKSETGILSDTLRDFKRFTATNIIDAVRNVPESRREWMLHRFKWNGSQNIRNTNNQFWIHDNHPELIHSQEFFTQKLNYIHENPVRAGIVYNAENYIYSSARTVILNKNGLIPITQD